MRLFTALLITIFLFSNVYADITFSGITVQSTEYDIILTGDSISRGNWNIALDGYATHYTDLVYTSTGIAGNTWSDLDTRFDADVVVYAPAVVMIHCGINDIVAGKTFADQQTYIDSIKTKCDTAGITLCIAEVLPYNSTDTHDTAIANWNTALTAYCTTNGITKLVCHDGMEDPENDNRPKPDYFYDYTHPTADGQLALGELYYQAYQYVRGH